MSWNHAVRRDHSPNAKAARGRLPFLRLLARVVSNPVGSWGEDFYDEPIVVYDDFGLQTVFVMDRELVQQILLDDIDAFTKSPLYDDVLGRAGGKGLLIAEGDDWRRQRRIAAPLFRAEAILSYAPAFAASCEPVLARWRKAAPGSLQIIGKDMTDAAMQALQDTILGADLREHDRKTVSEAGTAFLSSTTWKIAFASLSVGTILHNDRQVRLYLEGFVEVLNRIIKVLVFQENKTTVIVRQC